MSVRVSPVAAQRDCDRFATVFRKEMRVQFGVLSPG